MGLLLDLFTYGGVDLLGVFPLFLKMVADIIAPKFGIIFRGLIRWASFPECWRSANVTAIPKGAPSPDRKNYRPISMGPFCLRCMRSLLAYRKGRGTDVLLTISHYLQKSLDIGIVSYCSARL